MEILNQKKSRLGFWLAIDFLLVFFSVWIEVVFVSSKGDDLAGIGLLILGSPWSLLLIRPLMAIYLPNIVLYILGIGIPIIINTALIYFFGNFVGNLFQRSDDQSHEKDNLE